MKTTYTTHLSRILPALALLALSALPASAQIGSTSWTGNTSTDFYDGSNWTNGQYPNGNTTFVDSALTGAANTTVDRASGGNYIFGLYFNNTIGTQNSYTINGPQGFAIGGSVIRTAEVTSGSLTDVINADIADTGPADVWDIRANHHLDMNGVYSGGNTITKTGDGTLTFAGANTYTGATTINDGILKIDSATALGSTTAGTTVNSDGALDLNGIALNETSIALSGTGTDGAGGSGALMNSGAGINLADKTITLNGNTEIGGGGGGNISLLGGTSTGTGNGHDLTFVSGFSNWSANWSDLGTVTVESGTLLAANNSIVNAAANGAVIKTGAELFTWGSGHNFTADLTFETGAKFDTSWNGAGAGNAISEISGNVLLNGTAIFEGSANQAGKSVQQTVSGVISGTGGLTYGSSQDDNRLILTGTNTYTGDTTISATTGTLEIGGAGSLGAGGTYAGAITNNDKFKYNSTATQTLSGVISGAGTLEKDNTGTLTLSANNTYTGATSIEGGKLLISGDNASTEFTVGSGATLELASGFTIKGASNGSTIIKGDGALLVSGNVSGQADSLKMQMNSGASIDVQANITYGSGSDEWTGNLADLNVDGGIYGAANDIIANSLTGNGSISMGSGTIVVGVDDGDGIFNGNLSRNYADAHVRKEGSGTQTVTGSVNMGANGTVTVSEGTLIFNGTSSGSNATGSWTVEDGATLSGSGTLSGTATIGLGGILSPGNSPGTQTFDNLVWENGGTYLWEINADSLNGGSGTQGADPGWDWISVTNDWDISGITTNFNIDITSLTGANDAGLADGFDYSGKSYLDPFETFTILSFGTFDDTFDASLFSLNDSASFLNPKVGWSLEISGNDLVLNAVFVPEPSSTALLGLGGLALMLRRKRSAA